MHVPSPSLLHNPPLHTPLSTLVSEPDPWKNWKEDLGDLPSLSFPVAGKAGRTYYLFLFEHDEINR